jgi:hypothetical protein
MRPELAAIVTRLERAQDRLLHLESRTAPERWAARASPDQWSVGECVMHLNLTSRAYVPLLRQMFSDPAFDRYPAPRTYRRDLTGWLLSVTAGNLPVVAGRRLGRVRTAPRFVPEAELDREMVVAEFNTFQHELISLTRAADGKALHKMLVWSPFDARVSYNAYSCLVILPRHQERHLWQAEHVWDTSPSLP